MQIRVLNLEREPQELDQTLAPGAIDYGEEAEQAGPLTVHGRAEVLHEHRGPKEIVADIRLTGGFAGDFTAPCARCLDPVPLRLKGDFDLLFRPTGVDAGPNEHSISTQETEIGYYEEGGLLLEDVLREQVLLSLPARSLCRPDCKGLCPVCGENRNLTACECDSGLRDPRWEALAGLKNQIKN